MKKIFLLFFILFSAISFSSSRSINMMPLVPSGHMFLSNGSGEHMDGCDMDESECPDIDTCEEMHNTCMGDDTDMGHCNSSMMENQTVLLFLLNFLRFFLFV